MVKGEDQILLIKNKFRESEGYLNEMEKIFYNIDGDNPPEQAIPRLAMMAGKLTTNFSDIAVFLDIFPEGRD